MTMRLIPTKRGKKIIERLKKRNKFGKSRDIKLSKSKVEGELLASYKRMRPKIVPKGFQHPHGKPIVIFDENNTQIFRCLGKIPKKTLNKIVSRHPNATVLIDLDNGLYKQLPIKTFKKMTNIKFILFQRDYEFFGVDEFEPWSKSGEWYTPPEAISDTIYSINHLMKVLIIEEAFDKANEVFLSAKFYHLTGVDKMFKILYHNGDVEEIGYDDFINKYKLNVSMGLFEKKNKKKSVSKEKEKESKPSKKKKRSNKNGRKKSKPNRKKK